MTADNTHRDRWYWERFDPGNPHAGTDLALLRRGNGRHPGTVPELWRFHEVTGPEGVVPDGGAHMLAAEHAVLTLFGLHQHGQSTLVHVPGMPLFSALRRLRPQPRVSAETLDRRVSSAVTVAGLGALLTHLRGLVAQLRTIRQPLDYTALLHDIHDWHRIDIRAQVQRRWSTQYHFFGRLPEPTP